MGDPVVINIFYLFLVGFILHILGISECSIHSVFVTELLIIQEFGMDPPTRFVKVDLIHPHIIWLDQCTLDHLRRPFGRWVGEAIVDEVAR